ncbi:MAG: DUF4276 family protein [Terriglobia bacterium]|jgi:hypothetical protein
MVIQPLVEGYGEVEALPVLLRRLQAAAQQYGFQIVRPFRRKRSELTTEGSVRRSVRLALGTPDCAGIIILFDSDEEPACIIGPDVQRWAQAEAGPIPCQAVAVTREYEAWFISAIESLRGVRGISRVAISHPTPETVRNAKGALQARMVPGSFYSPTVDQAALTAQVDLAEVHKRCRSFRKMVKAFGVLAQATGVRLENWPPQGW